jgi:hypothetical protein
LQRSLWEPSSRPRESRLLEHKQHSSVRNIQKIFKTRH